MASESDKLLADTKRFPEPKSKGPFDIKKEEQDLKKILKDRVKIKSVGMPVQAFSIQTLGSKKTKALDTPGKQDEYRDPKISAQGYHATSKKLRISSAARMGCRPRMDLALRGSGFRVLKRMIWANRSSSSMDVLESPLKLGNVRSVRVIFALVVEGGSLPRASIIRFYQRATGVRGISAWMVWKGLEGVERSFLVFKLVGASFVNAEGKSRKELLHIQSSFQRTKKDAFIRVVV